jgi:hypothetical protein
VLREDQDIRIMHDVRKAAEPMKSFGGKSKVAWIMDEYRFQLELHLKTFKVPRHLTDVCVKGSGDLNCPG